MKVGRIVWIEWDDSEGFQGGPWHEMRDIIHTVKKTKPIQSVGILLKASKRWIILYSSWSGGTRIAEPFTIPRASIRRWGYLKKR